MDGTIDFSFLTANIQNLTDLSRPDVRECAAVAGRNSHYWVGQEIHEKQDDYDIDAVCPPDKWRHFHRSSENVGMARRSMFKLTPAADLPGGLDSAINKVQLHGGLKKVTPHRDMTWTIQNFVRAPKWTPIAFVGSHFVSGVDSGKAPRAERMQMRMQGMYVFKTQITRLHNAGVNVIFGVDSNWRRMPKVAPDQGWGANGTIDKVGFWEAKNSNYDLYVRSVERLPTPSDHDFFAVNFRAVFRSRSVVI